MNDKTEQALTDELRGTAACGHAEIINVPGYPLMVRAVDYNTLRAQLAEAQRDAERYRYLRTLDASRDPPADKTMWVVQYRHHAGEIPELVSGGFGESLDAAIDAAIDAAKGPA